MRRYFSTTAFVPVFVLLALFMGFRYKVGMDWNNYEYLHQALVQNSFWEVISRSEPLSMSLFWVSQEYGYDTILSNIIAAIIMLTGVFALSKRTPFPWIAVISALPYLLIAFGMTAIRQAMAIGIILFLYSRWDSYSMVRKAAFVVIAALFHTSAIVCMVLIAMELRINTIVKYVGITFFSILAFLLISNIGVFQTYIGSYQENYLGSDSLISPGALFHMGLVWLPTILFLVYRKRVAYFIPNYNLVFNASVLSVLMVAVYFTSSTVGSRLILYFYLIPMLVYPAMVMSFSERSRFIVRYALVAVNFLILFVWLSYANNADAHLPYRNFLIEQL